MDLNVSLVGTGNLGGPVARRLAAAGANIRVVARNPRLREQWHAEGVPVSASAADAAPGADVYIVFVFSDEQVDEVLDLALPRLAPGSVLVLHTTVSIATLDQAIERCRAAGVRLVDAPVDGSAASATEGRLVILVGAHQDDADRVAPVLSLYGTVHHVGLPGQAARVKLINNMMLAANLQVAAAGLELGEAMGVPVSTSVPAVSAMTGTSGGLELVSLVGNDLGILAEAVAPYMRKDVAACMASAKEAGFSPGWLAEVTLGGPMPLT